MNSLSGKVSDDRRPVLHNRGIIRRVYRWFVSLMSRKVPRPPSTVERKGVDNASLVANGSVKELGLRVVNHLANYSLPFPSFASFLPTRPIERYISIKRATTTSELSSFYFLVPPKSLFVKKKSLCDRKPFFESSNDRLAIFVSSFFLSRKGRRQNVKKTEHVVHSVLIVLKIVLRLEKRGGRNEFK